jgi:DNA-binding CsgD family transcriptional regulator/tetratricopeptide (TPR) repeat protein
VRSRASLSEAMRAWCAGDFERCIELCDGIRVRDPATRTRVGLLRARSLLRLGRANEALRELNNQGQIHPTPDLVATALMLTAAAQVRLGESERALRTIEHARAVPGDVHPTIRSEIALTAALAHYGLRSFGDAQRELSLVDADADIVYARALEYRGMIELARVDTARACGYFVDALAQLGRCRNYDRYLEANVLGALAFVAVERLELSMWRGLQPRMDALDWSAPGLSRLRFGVACYRSVFQECEGDTRGALRSALDALSCAGNDAQHAQAVLRRAEIVRGCGDTAAHIAFVDEADRLLSAIPTEALAGDQAYIALTLAEEFALYGDVAKAEAALVRFRSVERPLGMPTISAELRSHGFVRMAEAHVAAARSDEASALRAFLDAFETFERIGYRRRATMAALRLDMMTRSGRYRQYAVAATEGLADSFWMRRKALPHDRPTVDAIIERLSPLQRDTVRLIYAGLTNRQIATAQDRAYKTVRNMVSDLLHEFEVKDRRRLIVACRHSRLLE